MTSLRTQSTYHSHVNRKAASSTSWHNRITILLVGLLWSLSAEAAESLGFMEANRKSPTQYAFVPESRNSATGPLKLALNAPQFYGERIGREGIAKVSLGDGSGDAIITTASNTSFGLARYWYVSKYDPANNRIAVLWTSPVGTVSNRISSLTLDDSSAEHPIVMVGRENGVLEFLDFNTKTLIDEIQLDHYIRDAVVVDADNDGSLEVVVITQNNSQNDGSLYLLSLSDYSVEQQLSFLATELAAGSVDTDPNTEIVLNSGYVIEFSNGSFELEWDQSALGFGRSMRLGDVTLNGRQDIVALDNDVATAYDGALQQQLWQFEVLGSRGFLLADIAGDALPELIVYDDTVNAYDVTLESALWSYSTDQSGIDGIELADVNGDGSNEITLGSGGNSTAADHIHVISAATGSAITETRAPFGPFDLMEAGDIDNDGQKELLMGSRTSESQFGSGPTVLNIFNAASLKVESEELINFGFQNYFAIVADDLDNDGLSEVAFGSEESFSSNIYISDGMSFELENNLSIPGEFLPGNVDFLGYEDVDNDGDGELIVVRGDSPALFIVDPTNSNIEWQLSDLNGLVRGLEVTNIDDDAALEIVMISGSNIVVVDGQSESVWTSSDFGFYALAAIDADGDSVEEIVAIRDDSSLVLLDGETLEFTPLFDGCSSSFTSGSLVAVPMPRLGEPMLIYQCDNLTTARGLQTGQLYFEGGELPIIRELQDNSIVSSTLGIGHQIIVSTDFGFAVYETNNDTDVLTDNSDNCQLLENHEQHDIDADGFGDVCDTDYNNDCIVNFLDIAALSEAFLSDDSQFDNNSDGIVNFLDFVFLANNFLQPPGPSGKADCSN